LENVEENYDYDEMDIFQNICSSAAERVRFECLKYLHAPNGDS